MIKTSTQNPNPPKKTEPKGKKTQIQKTLKTQKLRNEKIKA